MRPTKPTSSPPGAGLARDAEELPVVAAQPDRRLAVAVQAQDDVLVDLADEDHLGHLDGLGVGHAQAADELDRQPQALHVGGDLRAAAVDDDRVQPDVLEQHDVARELLAQRRVLHRRAAVLDDDRLAVELPDVGERLEQRADGVLRRLPHVVYSALIVTYSWLRSEKKTSVSWPSPGRSTTYSTSSRATACASASRVEADARRRARRPARPRSRRRRPAARCRAAPCPTACTIRPQLGSPPCSAVLTSGELATARATRSTPSACAAAHDDAADAPGALAVAHDVQRELAQQRVERLAEAQLVLGLGLDGDAAGARAHEDRGVVGRQLAVDRDAVERALDAHAEQQVGGLGRQRGVGLHEAQHRREGRRDHARALGLRAQAHGPARQVDLERRALLERVGGHDRRGEVGVAVGAQLAARAREPADHGVARRAGRR